MATYAPSRHAADMLTIEDFDTASIHSASPSYVSEVPSEVPSYTSSLPPPYEAEQSTSDTTTSTSTRSAPARRSATTQQRGLPPVPSHPRGLPPLPSTPAPMPSLSAFSIPSWSTFSANPTTRHYHSVAQRRVAAANDRIGSPLHRHLLDRVVEEGDDSRPRSSSGGGGGAGPSSSIRVGGPGSVVRTGWAYAGGRPLEDPSIVGEESARRARDERMRRERNAALVLDDQRWDLYLSQMNQWQARERTWSRITPRMNTEERKSFMRRISGRIFS
ncbi:uncharacterized protein DNG_03063 [Cephalotrichum gorgonifer]|uniref:Uncharacterized protein n=1 Tax=Cephalotrichum gorgonifer TaxID=2041049 RepID=A0AAE8MUF8_9PEZI|nr:uncharacterized protein DNG_03063 [Cephalotrichum gorgonifer]